MHLPVVASRKLSPSNAYLAPLLGVSPLEFHQDIWHTTTRLQHNVLCIIICLIILVELWLVTNRQKDRHGYGTYHASTVSHSKNYSVSPKNDIWHFICNLSKA